MAGQEFFEGEQVGIYRVSDADPMDLTPPSMDVVPGKVAEPFFIGIIKGHDEAELTRGHVGDVRERVSRHLVGRDYGDAVFGVYENGRLIEFYDERHNDFVDGTYVLQRLNPGELEDGFADALQREVGMVEGVVQSADVMKRAAALSTLRSLNSYLNGDDVSDTQNPF